MGDLSRILILVGGLTLFVNVITEVIKEVCQLKEAKSINLFVTVLSVVLTVTSLIAYCQISAITITWYMAVAFVIVGFMVAYSAMFGYDKLLSYFEDRKKE